MLNPPCSFGSEADLAVRRFPGRLRMHALDLRDLPQGDHD